MVPATVAMLRKVNSDAKRLPGFVASAPGRCDQLRAEIAQVTEAGILPRLWQEQVRPLVVEACDMLAAATSHAGTTFVTSPRKLAKLVGEADASLLLSGQQTEDVPLASLGPVIGLARLARGEIDRDTFTRQYGHRSSQELELSVPRPAEDPAWIDGQLAAFRDADTEAVLARQDAARAAAWARLARQDPRKAAAARKIVARWAPIARDREAARSEVARSVWVARTWVLRAGDLTGHGDDLFFLELPEILGLLRGETVSPAKVPARQAAYDTFRALPSYPALIRGRFDPVRWAADPNRRSDYYDEYAQLTETGDRSPAFLARPAWSRASRGSYARPRRPLSSVTARSWSPRSPTSAGRWSSPAPRPSSPTSARRCPMPRSWPASSASRPWSGAATPPCASTAATGSGSTAAEASSRCWARSPPSPRRCAGLAGSELV